MPLTTVSPPKKPLTNLLISVVLLPFTLSYYVVSKVAVIIYSLLKIIASPFVWAFNFFNKPKSPFATHRNLIQTSSSASHSEQIITPQNYAHLVPVPEQTSENNKEKPTSTKALALQDAEHIRNNSEPQNRDAHNTAKRENTGYEATLDTLTHRSNHLPGPNHSDIIPLGQSDESKDEDTIVSNATEIIAGSNHPTAYLENNQTAQERKSSINPSGKKKSSMELGPATYLIPRILQLLPPIQLTDGTTVEDGGNTTTTYQVKAGSAKAQVLISYTGKKITQQQISPLSNDSLHDKALAHFLTSAGILLIVYRLALTVVEKKVIKDRKTCTEQEYKKLVGRFVVYEESLDAKLGKYIRYVHENKKSKYIHTALNDIKELLEDTVGTFEVKLDELSAILDNYRALFLALRRTTSSSSSDTPKNLDFLVEALRDLSDTKQKVFGPNLFALVNANSSELSSISSNQNKSIKGWYCEDFKQHCFFMEMQKESPIMCISNLLATLSTKAKQSTLPTSDRYYTKAKQLFKQEWYKPKLDTVLEGKDETHSISPSSPPRTASTESSSDEHSVTSVGTHDSRYTKDPSLLSRITSVFFRTDQNTDSHESDSNEDELPPSNRQRR